MKSTFIIFIFIAQILSKQLPDFYKACNRNDPNLDTCLKNSFLSMKPYMVKGVPEIKLPSMEPLKLKEFLILNINSENVDFKLSVKNVKVYGASEFDISNFHFNLKDTIMSYTVILNRIFIKGFFENGGRIFSVPINAPGKFVVTLNDVLCHYKIFGKIVNRKDKDYLNVDKVDLDMKIGSGSMNMTGLLGNVINNVVNDSFDILMPELIPIAEKEMAAYFQKAANKLLNLYTYDQILH